MKIRLVLVNGEVKEYDGKKHGYDYEKYWLRIYNRANEYTKLLIPRENVKFLEVKGND